MSQTIQTVGDSEEHLAAENQIDANDLLLAKQIADVLMRHYPGHAWMVNVDGKQGVANIKNGLMSGLYGYRLLLPQLISATDLDHRVMKAGGEILERFNTPRGRFDGEQWAGLPVTAAGTPLFQKD